MAMNITLTWSAIGLAFATWCVALGGISSLQRSCDVNDKPHVLGLMGIRGLSGGLGCSKIYRYYWFMIALELILLTGLAASIVAGVFRKTRLSWLGLFVVSALLYIQATDTFLTFTNRSFFDGDDAVGHRARTALAGYLMTAIANCIAIIILGLEPAAAEEPAKADTVQATAV